MSENLKNKTIQALLWSLVERVGQQGIHFIISIILARLLLPEQFGLIAMLMVFIAIANSFIDSGFSQALIQKQDTEHIDKCSIFFFNILVGFIAAGLLCLAAPLIAGFYRQSLLIPITYALSLNLIINAFGAVQLTLLTKAVDFKTQMKVSFTATAISGTIGIAMAISGYEVWSLVVQSISANFIRTALLWFFNNWKPTLVFSYRSLRNMFSFGSRLLVSGLLDTTFRNIYLVVIGKIFSPADLGYYSRAQHLQELPSSNIFGIIGRVTFPVFSIVQDDKVLLKSAVKKALAMLGMINFPIMIGLAVIARPFILLLLTEKWAPCIPYLQLLCIAGMLYPIHAINLNVLKAQGRSDLFLRLEIIKKVLILLAIAITYRWGIKAMIYGQIGISFLAYLLNSYYTGRMLDYPITKQLQDLRPSLILASAMGAAVYGLSFIPVSNLLIIVFLQIIAGIVIYVLLCQIFHVSSYLELIQIVKSNLFPQNNAKTDK